MLQVSKSWHFPSHFVTSLQHVFHCMCNFFIHTFSIATKLHCTVISARNSVFEKQFMENLAETIFSMHWKKYFSCSQYSIPLFAVHSWIFSFHSGMRKLNTWCTVLCLFRWYVRLFRRVGVYYWSSREVRCWRVSRGCDSKCLWDLYLVSKVRSTGDT